MFGCLTLFKHYLDFGLTHIVRDCVWCENYLFKNELALFKWIYSKKERNQTIGIESQTRSYCKGGNEFFFKKKTRWQKCSDDFFNFMVIMRSKPMFYFQIRWPRVHLLKIGNRVYTGTKIECNAFSLIFGSLTKHFWLKAKALNRERKFLTNGKDVKSHRDKRNCRIIAHNKFHWQSERPSDSETIVMKKYEYPILARQSVDQLVQHIFVNSLVFWLTFQSQIE